MNSYYKYLIHITGLIIKHTKINNNKLNIKNLNSDFPGGAVVKNPPANAGDTGSSPGPGRFHMPRSN